MALTVALAAMLASAELARAPLYLCLAGPGVMLDRSLAVDERTGAILDIVAAQVRVLDPPPRIQLIGVADQGVGRDEGLRLALLRATLIRDELVRRGVPRRLLFIATSDRGQGLNHFVGIFEIVSPAERARRAEVEAALAGPTPVC